MKKVLSVLLAAAAALALAGYGGSAAAASTAPQEKTSLVFADVGWDSAKLNNALAGLVAEEIFGYTWEWSLMPLSCI